MEIRDLKKYIENFKSFNQRVAIKEVLDDGDHEHTFIDLYNDVLLVASLLKDKEFENTNIGLLAENSYMWLVSYFGIVLSNNVVVPIDKDISITECSKIIKRLGIDTIFVSNNSYKRYSILDKVELINFDQKNESTNRYSFKDFNNGSNSLEDEVATIILTSGTSGFNKAVMLTHKNICANLSSIERLGIVTKFEGNLISILPMNHSFELFCNTFASLYYGLTLIIDNNPRNYIKNLITYKPEVHVVVPSLFTFLSHKVDSFKDQRFKIVVGGAAVDKNVYKFMIEKGFDVYTGYGMSEASPLISLNTNHNDDAMTSDFFFTNIKIGDLINDQEGEILIKGDNVTPGYYQDEKATKESYTSDGWFKTGDIGYIEDNKLHFTGRLKNTIILENGKNVQPEQVEDIIHEKIPYLDDVVVCEMVLNNKPCIGAVCYSSIINLLDNSEKVINDFKEINKYLEPHQKICGVAISNTVLPKNQVLKIIRKSIKESLKKYKTFSIQ